MTEELQKPCGWCGDLCITNPATLNPMCSKTQCIIKGIKTIEEYILSYQLIKGLEYCLELLSKKDLHGTKFILKRIIYGKKKDLGLCLCNKIVIKTNIAEEGTQSYMCETCNKPIPDWMIK